MGSMIIILYCNWQKFQYSLLHFVSLSTNFVDVVDLTHRVQGDISNVWQNWRSKNTQQQTPRSFQGFRLESNQCRRQEMCRSGRTRWLVGFMTSSWHDSGFFSWQYPHFIFIHDKGWLYHKLQIYHLDWNEYSIKAKIDNRVEQL